MIFSGPMIYDCPFTSEYEKYLGNFEMIDFIVVWWTVFLNVMILSGPMIYDSPFISEYEKNIENFELIDFIDVWWTVFFYCDDFVWTNDLWFPIYIWIWKINREFWNDRLHWRLMNRFFFEFDDFVWTNDFWFSIYIWMWKKHREIWNDRFHWRLMNSFFMWWFCLVEWFMVPHLHVNMKNTSRNLKL